MTTYHDYSRDNLKWFFGLSGWQIAALAVGSLPVVVAVRQSRWALTAALLAVWVVAAVLVVVPIRGRSATGWLTAAAAHWLGTRMSWTTFEARAARGRAGDLDAPDLPGVLQAITVHHGPVGSSTRARVGLIEDRAARTWAVTARVRHPGIGLADHDERRRYGEGLTCLLDAVARTDLVEDVIFVSRTVPEDGAERELWVREHRTPATRSHHPGDDAINADVGPALAARVTDELAAALTGASVRHEHFVTVVVPDARLARPARAAGGGLEGRGRELQLLMGEVEAQLRGGLGMSEVSWLSPAELAVACRTGFAPGDRLGVVHAQADPTLGVETDVPWAMAGPSGAETSARHYRHDAWSSISVTLALPPGGVTLGALAPVVTPTEAGERRSLMVCFPILAAGAARRRSANTEWAVDTGLAVRTTLGMKTPTSLRDNATRARDMDARLARGHCLIRPYAVCTVTVPSNQRIHEFGRRLDASVRRCGFAPLRLDLAQDTAFAAACIPLGVSLSRRSR